jgi:hypothetical protein
MDSLTRHPFQAAVRDKISLTTKSGPGNDRRTELRTELDSLREKQATSEHSRTKLKEQKDAFLAAADKKVNELDPLTQLFDRSLPVQKKDLDAAKSKIRYKNVAEVDAQIK